MRVVRKIWFYRRRNEAASFLPDSRLFPPRHQVVRPHLFTNAEVVHLLAAISALPAARTSPVRRENLRLPIVLLYTTGLRLGELVRLTMGDYDPREHTLLIRDLVDILTISQWLGQATVTTTNRYATTDLEMKRKAIEQAHAIDRTTDDGAALWRTDASILAWLEAL
jgi:integrase